MTDSIYRLRPATCFACASVALLCLGVLMVESATMRVTGTAGWHWSADGTKQLVFAAVAAGVFLLVGRLDYRRLDSRRGWAAARPSGPVVAAAGRACWCSCRTSACRSTGPGGG